MIILPRKRKAGKRKMETNTTIRDVFQRFLPEYAEVNNFSERQHLTARCIINCRTSEMGANVTECEACNKIYVHYNSCKNRHCPMCQGMDIAVWIDKQKENVLDIPYFHTVFTVPDILNPLIYSNQQFLYDALYHAANKTLTELSANPKYLGAKIGYICVLHTWGARMNYHPHLHTIVLGGGLDKTNHWIDKKGKMFFPVKVMSAIFKKYYLEELKELWKNNKLEYHGSASKYKNHYEFKILLDKLYEIDWVTYMKPAFGGAQAVINYLGRYINRIAISNNRIEEIVNDQVRFRAKNYKNNGKMEPISVDGTEFIRLFLMHVLPKGFVRIRHYGLLSCRSKKEKMTLCRNILGCEQYLSNLRDKTMAEKILILYNRDLSKCRYCGEPIHTYKIPGKYMLC